MMSLSKNDALKDVDLDQLDITNFVFSIKKEITPETQEPVIKKITELSKNTNNQDQDIEALIKETNEIDSTKLKSILERRDAM